MSSCEDGFRIEKEIFPEYKDEEVFLLDVTWEEDYIQKLGEIPDIVILNFSRQPGHFNEKWNNGIIAMGRVRSGHNFIKS